MSRIMFNDMPYTKYRDENQKGEKTWRCSQAGCCVTIKTNGQLITSTPGKHTIE